MSVSSVDSDSESLREFVVPDDEIIYESDKDDIPKTRKRTRRNSTFRPQKKLKRNNEEQLRCIDNILKSKFSEIVTHINCPASVNSAQEVIGREDEVKRVFSMLHQPLGGIRPLLLGPEGIGKYSIVQKLANNYHLMHQGSSRRFYSLDCRALIANSLCDNITKIIGSKLQCLVQTIYNVDGLPPVLMFNHIDRLLNLDHICDFVLDLLRKPLPIIASISEHPKDEKVTNAIAKLSRFYFEPIVVSELSIETVQLIVRRHILQHPLDKKIIVNEAAIDLGVRLAAKYIQSTPLPNKAIYLIQECANRTLLSRHEDNQVVITQENIALLVEEKTGIHSEDLMDDAIFNEKRLMERLKANIVGQDSAIDTVSRHITCFKLGLLDPKKPWGVFLFIGPTGVGKTELARNLAKHLFHDDKYLVCLDGSEYKESHTVSNLIGAPRGYEGHDSGGMLTEPLMQNPYLVVLFDEFEKAHEDVRRLFLQVFDRGCLTDRRGKVVDCTKALFIMTSNLGSNILFEKENQETHDVLDAIKPTLVEHLSPELCNRFSAIVPFQPMRRKHLLHLIQVQLKRIQVRLQTNANLHFLWTDDIEKFFLEQEFDFRFGMRHICRMIESTVIQILKDAISLNNRLFHGKVCLSMNQKGEFTVTLTRKGPS